jgi:uncharacterized protein (DUF885 family)
MKLTISIFIGWAGQDWFSYEVFLRDPLLNIKGADFIRDLLAFFEFLRTDEQFCLASEQTLIDGYTQIIDKIDSRLLLLFDVFPKADS